MIFDRLFFEQSLGSRVDECKSYNYLYFYFLHCFGGCVPLKCKWIPKKRYFDIPRVIFLTVHMSSGLSWRQIPGPHFIYWPSTTNFPCFWSRWTDLGWEYVSFSEFYDPLTVVRQSGSLVSFSNWHRSSSYLVFLSFYPLLGPGL